ncbi:MAG: hypothetical protein H7Y42_17030 [Chitinophagaceae bacterium]|nr:hypothetical protein [Chitinophagaceae bacterium]
MNFFLRAISIPYKFLLITLTMLFSGLIPCDAQNIDATIGTYADKYGQERAYFHYDKSAYAAGETVWFKAYLMTEILPSHESKTLYTDWIDENGSLLHHMVSPMVDAVTNGQFDIPAEYKGKVLHVRAYTKWMLNFDSTFLYTKTIPILSREGGPTPAKALPVSSISFFPEGGDAILGLSNKIAFKANDQWGRPVRVRGVVLGSDGKIADSLRTMHDGMGFFNLTPQAGLSYSVRWKDEKAVERTTPLPVIKKEGVALEVTLSGANRSFNVRFTPEMAAASDTFHIVGTMYQRQAFRIARPTRSPIKGLIPTGALPSGILTITVFDSKWKALAERITYVNNWEFDFTPEMEVQHWGLNKRARNEVRITIPDSISADLSISVTDMSIGTDSNNNIVSHLMLSSDLKGDIYRPSYYFSNRSDSISQHLDLVMLTHGWRRFKWDDIVSGKFPKLRFERDTSYLTMSGKIYGMLPGQIEPGASIFLIVKQKDVEGKFLVVPVKTDGTFRESSLILFDTANVYYQFQKSKAKGINDVAVQFMTDRLPSPSLKGPFTPAKGASPDTSGYFKQWLLANEANMINERLRVKTLENVTVRSRGKTPIQLMDEKYASGLFKDGDGYQFDLLNDPFAISGGNIFNYLQGKVAGLQINTTGGTPSLQWRGGSPQIYLDEVPTNPEFISSVNVSDVAYIKVFRPPFLGGFNGANGAIAIYTRRGGDVKAEPGKGLSNNKVFGYTAIREFYSPNYGSFKVGNDQRDVRTTLYWNPSVIVTPQRRQATINFYNNDVTKGFRVVIEGMTRDGRLAHVEQIME